MQRIARVVKPRDQRGTIDIQRARRNDPRVCVSERAVNFNVIDSVTHRVAQPPPQYFAVPVFVGLARYSNP